jgi:putative addiction module component (TIGR02574 family)
MPVARCRCGNPKQILGLSIAERIELIGEIRDSMATVPEAIALTEAQKAELDRRLDAYHENPTAGSPWPVVGKPNRETLPSLRRRTRKRRFVGGLPPTPRSVCALHTSNCSLEIPPPTIKHRPSNSLLSLFTYLLSLLPIRRLRRFPSPAFGLRPRPEPRDDLKALE